MMMGTHAMQDVKQKCKNDFLSAYAAELVFWPAFQVILHLQCVFALRL